MVSYWVDFARDTPNLRTIVVGRTVWLHDTVECRSNACRHCDLVTYVAVSEPVLIHSAGDWPVADETISPPC